MSKWFEMIGENDWMGRTMISMVKNMWMNDNQWSFHQTTKTKGFEDPDVRCLKSRQILRQPSGQRQMEMTAMNWGTGRLATFRHGFHPLGLHGNSALQRTTGALDPLPWSAERISNHMIHMAFLQLVDLGNKRQLNKKNILACLWAYSCQLNMTVSGPNPRLAMSSKKPPATIVLEHVLYNQLPSSPNDHPNIAITAWWSMCVGWKIMSPDRYLQLLTQYIEYIIKYA